MLESQEKRIPIEGPKTIDIGIKNARDIVDDVFKENDFKPDSVDISFYYNFNAVRVFIKKDDWFFGEYISIFTDLFWDLIRTFALKAIEELNKKCSNLKKRRSLTD